ncbi:hypothetical protein ABTY96_14370 [Streptomyces sp. NPDC096057]|uniref:hypothetical protein n=1 Tax=Streptomyces sp. NPDC096057 TaxID=3155543 RepID=UPI00331CF6EB
MRWLTLYARSRQVPASLAALVIGAVSVWAVAPSHGVGAGDPRPAVLGMAVGVVAASVGFGGQDVALDRTAAVRWVPRRAAHVLVAGVVVAAVSWGWWSSGLEPGGAEVLVRGSAGLTGLAALGAALSGGQYAWTLPFGWLSFSFFAPPATSTATRVTGWLLLPPGIPAGTWTAVVLLVAGTSAYSLAGPRR